MPVYKRGGIWHYDFTVRGERYRGSTGARLKEDALRIEKREQRAALLGNLHQSLTLAEAADQWFRARRAGSKSAKDTAHRIEIMLRLVPGETLVSQIGARLISEAMNLRRFEPIRRGRNRKDTGALPTNATINRDLIDSTLRPILNYAATSLEADVKRIAWAELRLPEPRERVAMFTAEQITDWTADLPHWHRPILRHILRYGVRLTEAFVPLSAYHDDGENLDIYTRDRKNGPQVVTLLPEDAAEMRARIGRAKAAKLDTPWFREMRDGSLRTIQPRGFQSASATALKRIGMSEYRAVHDGRHHAATTFLRLSDGDLARLKELLGHESIQSTMRYAHTSRDDLRRALSHAYATTVASDAENPHDNNAKTAT